MYNVIISHPVLDEGMKLFDGRAKVYVANSADPKAYYAQLADAEAVILRLATFDREAFAHAPKLRVIGRRKSTEGYEIVVRGTRKLLRRSRLSADLVSGNTSRLTGSLLIVDRHKQGVSDKVAGGLGNRLPHQIRLYFLHNRALII